MTSRAIARLGLAIVLYGCRVASVLGVSADRNLVRNPGFEETAGALPATWIPQNQHNGRIQLDESLHGSGSRSLLLTPNAKNTNPEKPLGVGQQFLIQEAAGRQLTVRALMRVRDGAVASLLVFVVNAKGKFIGVAHLQQGDPTPGFEAKQSTLAVDPAATSIIVACGVTGRSGAAWFDDVFVGVSDATPSGPSADSGQPIRATLTVDARQIVRKLPKTLYGANTEWIYDGHGLWDSRTGRLNSQFVDSARKMGLGLCRYPGGVLADYYHWRDGVGPIDKRPTVPFLVDPTHGRIAFGTEEFLDFCRAAGAEPLLQTNVVTGSPGEAADWVTYCNNKGRPENYRVHFWELGNEQYMKHESRETAQSQLDVQTYIRKVREFAAAMKARDPSIAVGAVSGENFGNYHIVENESWNREVLRNTGSVIDFIALHNGYAPVVLDQKNLSFDEVYRALLGFPVLLEQELKQINHEIEQYAPADAARLKIAITEWGPLFAFGPTSSWVGHTKTLGSALFAASVLQTMFRSERVDMAAFFQLFSRNNFSGWIGQDGNLKATAYAVEMYTHHFGPNLVGTTVESPDYRTNGVGVVAAVPAVPYLDAAASLSADQSRLYLTVVNKSLLSSAQAFIRLDGFVPRSVAHTWVLTAPSLDANNGNDLPSVPGVHWAAQAHSPSHSMFDQGSPGAVAIRPGPDVTNAKDEFSFEFPPMSLTSIELIRR